MQRAIFTIRTKTLKRRFWVSSHEWSHRDSYSIIVNFYPVDSDHERGAGGGHAHCPFVTSRGGHFRDDGRPVAGSRDGSRPSHHAHDLVADAEEGLP